MTTNTEGLKPCPFCGEDFNLYGGGIIACDNCGAEGPTSEKLGDNYLERWNRRPTAQASEAIRNAALEEAAKVAERPYQIFSIGGSLIMDSNQTEAIAKAIRALSTMPVEPVTNGDKK